MTADNRAEGEALASSESVFMDAVWDALKADANDLRKQQRILRAFRAALIPRPAEPAQEAQVDDHGFFELIVDAMAEANKAMRKFPQPNYVISKVAEEAGEVVKAAIHCAEGRETFQSLRGEMKQCIAMLYRLWVEGDQVHGLPPVANAIIAAAQEGRG